MSNGKLGTVLDGLFATSNIDSSGEVIEIEGVDASTLDIDGVANWEHKGDSPNQIVGKVLFYKKLLKRDDCENDRQRYFWDKAESPCIYGKIVLFDEVGHEGAKSIVAMLKFDQKLDKTDTRQVMGFSIEGSRLGKEGNRITKCIARRIAISNFPCNKTCIAEILEEDKPIEITAKQLLAAFKKSEEMETDLKKDEYNTKLAFKLTPKPKKVETYKPITTATGEHREGSEIKPKEVVPAAKAPEKQKIGQRTDYTSGKPKMRTGYQIYHDPETWKSETNTVRKNILKSMTKQNIQRRLMLSEEKENMRKDILKNMADDAFEHFEKKEELVGFVASQYPEMTQEEVLAFAKTFAYVQMKKSEMEMVKITDNIEGNDLQKDEKGVHKPYLEGRYANKKQAGKASWGTSKAGFEARLGSKSNVSRYSDGEIRPDSDKRKEYKQKAIESSKNKHKKVLSELKEMKAPNLPKSETDMVKARVDEGKSIEQKQSDRKDRNSRVKFAAGSPKGSHEGKDVRPRKQGEGDKVFGKPKDSIKGVRSPSQGNYNTKPSEKEHPAREAWRKEAGEKLSNINRKNLKQMPNPDLPKSEQDMVKAIGEAGYTSPYRNKYLREQDIGKQKEESAKHDQDKKDKYEKDMDDFRKKHLKPKPKK
jgi:hypothetical protein